MNRSPLTPRRVLLALAGLLLVNSQLGPRYAGAVGSPFRGLLDTVLGPVEYMLGGFAAKARPGPDPLRYDNDQDLASVIADRDHYKALFDDQKDKTAKLQAEISQHKNAMQHYDYSGSSIVDARVLAFNGSTNHPILTIDRGSAYGIDKGMSVERDGNLVGVVESVSSRTARLKLFTAEPAFRVRVTPPQVAAAQPRAGYELTEIIQRRSDGQSYQLDVKRDGPGEVGDYAHLADDARVFPDYAQSRIIGRVSKVEDIPLKPLLKRLIIRPTLPLARLSRVSVIVPAASDEGAGP